MVRRVGAVAALVAVGALLTGCLLYDDRCGDESRDDFAVLLELPVETGVGDQALTGVLRPYAGPTPFVELFDLVRAGRVALKLTTDIPGRESLRRTLVPDAYEGWSRPHCS